MPQSNPSSDRSPIDVSMDADLKRALLAVIPIAKEYGKSDERVFLLRHAAMCQALATAHLDFTRELELDRAVAWEINRVRSHLKEPR